MKGLLFTYALTYGGAGASLVKPWYGLLIYVCFAIIKPEQLWFWSVPEGNYSRIVAVGLLLGWAAGGFGNWRLGQAATVVCCLIGYMAAMVVSAALAVASADVSWQIVETTAKIVLPCLAAITLIESVAQLRQLAWVMLLSVGYLAYDLNLDYYANGSALDLVWLQPLDNNGSAALMDLGVGLAFFMAFGERVWWRRWLAFGLGGLMVNTVMFSNSRGGILGLLVTGLMSFLLVPKRPKTYAMLALALALGFRLAGTETIERFATVFRAKEERDSSAESRLALSQNCLELMVRHPLTGVGPQNFPLIAEEFGWPKGKQAHTTWLQIGAEQGLTGLALLLGYYGLTVFHLWDWRHRLARFDPWLVDLSRMITASLVGFGASAQFVSLQVVEIPYYMAMLGAAALKLASRSALSPPQITPRAAVAAA